MAKPTSNQFSLVTKKGYNLFDVASALQKSVRRGDLKNASYWAFELYNSNFEKYLWKRLLVMATEDVGLGDRDAMRDVQMFYENYKSLKELDTWERVRPCMAAVFVMTRAKKSQFFNWFWGNENDEHATHNMRIPEYALDRHTRRGKIKGKTMADFFEDGAKINNPNPVEDEDDRKERSAEYHRTINDPKWKACEFLPVGHPDRDPQGPPPKEVRTGDAPVRRRTVKPAEGAGEQKEMLL